MKRYDSYKDSGVKWLGEIPSHWEVVPMKYYTNIIMGQSPDGSQVKDSGTTLFMQGNAEFGSKTPSPTLYCDNCKKHSRVGDILMSVRAPVGATNISDKVYGIGRGLCSIRANSVSRNYLWYYLKVCQLGFKELSKGSTFESVSVDDIKSLTLLMPHAIEQDAIADYLNDIVSRIDSVISQQQKMIDLLNERKQIIINNAVTKGLDPNVKMKPSGIDWIGDINENWDLYKLKHLLKSNLMYGANESAESDDLSLPRYIRITDIDEDGNLRPDTFKSLSREKATPYLLKRGDVLFARSGATAGKSYLFDEDLEACFAGYLIKASLKESLQPKFLAYYTKSGIYDNWKNSIFIQATIPNIGADKYANLMIPLPSMKEQIIIIQQLDIETEKLNNIIRACKKQISLLQERKQIIINDVVTGKVKVI